MKHKLLILEGPDCSGKTTLAKYLSREFRAAYFKMTRTAELQGTLLMYDYMRTMQAAIQWNLQNGLMVVLDRCWISEYVYSRVMRETEFTYWRAYWPELDRHIQSMGGLYIFAERSGVIQAHRENVNHDHPYNDEDFRDITKAYIHFRKTWEEQGREDYVVYQFDTMAQDLGIVKRMIEDIT